MVGGYELLGRVASGSTAVVWKARDTALGRDVALKEVPGSQPELVARMREEAGVLASLDDEHVVEVYGFVEEGGSAYLVEQWIDGATLAAMIAAGSRPTAPQAMGVVRGALLGLDHAHGRGVVHGDVSASNILVDTDGVSRLIDFGRGGRGTPAYRSPEVGGGAAPSPASDVYASAAVLTHLLTGSPAATSVGGTHPGIQPVLRVAMDEDPASRYPDAGAFLAALSSAAEESIGSGWWTQAGLGALVPPGIAVLTGLGGSGAAGVGVVAAPATASRLPLIAGLTTAGALVVGGLVVGANALSKDDEPSAGPSAASTPVAGVEDDDTEVTEPVAEETPDPQEVLEQGLPTGRWRVVLSGRQLLENGTRRKRPTDSGTWTFRSGECTAASCTGSIRDSLFGDTYTYVWTGKSFTIKAPPSVQPKDNCIDDATGKPVPIAEAGYSSRSPRSPKPFRVTSSDATGAPTAIRGSWTYVTRYKFFGNCDIAPDAVVSGTTIMTLTPARKPG